MRAQLCQYHIACDWVKFMDEKRILCWIFINPAITRDTCKIKSPVNVENKVMEKDIQKRNEWKEPLCEYI